jgi:hypothetical protein
MLGVAPTAGERFEASRRIVRRRERETHGRGFGDEASGVVIGVAEVEPRTAAVQRSALPLRGDAAARVVAIYFHRVGVFHFNQAAYWIHATRRTVCCGDVVDVGGVGSSGSSFPGISFGEHAVELVVGHRGGDAAGVVLGEDVAVGIVGVADGAGFGIGGGDQPRERSTRDSGIKYGGACIARGRIRGQIERGRENLRLRTYSLGRVGVMDSLPPNNLTARKTMNNREFDRVSQKDREFEELLCLSYLFTHSGYVEAPGESEVHPADDAELYPHYSCN